MLRRQLACSPLPLEPLYEKRYPYLDRNFMEYIYSVPREQLVRPGQRRSLMRRALISIVPSEILNRKRKAYVTRGPLANIATAFTDVIHTAHQMITAQGIINPESLNQAFEDATLGKEVAAVPLMRLMALESWLRGIQHVRSEISGLSLIALKHSASAMDNRTYSVNRVSLI